MIDILDKHRCCGCEACVQACPKHCIAFEGDSEGFSYPVVDKEKCIECGQCEKVCPVICRHDSTIPLKVFAAQNTDEAELLSSSSGGLFIVLAKKTLSAGGVVFGARFDDHWNVIHSYAETIDEVQAFMGSKYVQSRIGATYIQARDFLKAGRKVLFSGTPCQVAGLKNFLRKDYDNLLTVDVICHGVPSPMVWQRYLSELRQNARKGENSVSSSPNHSISEGDALPTRGSVSIESISFRDKRSGWKKFSFALTLAEASAEGKKNTVSLSHIFNEDPYMKLFLDNLILRPSCYQCPAKSGKSCSDITIADFWGIEKYHPQLDDSRGVGLMMVNSSKGMGVLSSLNIKRHEVSYDDAVESNSSYEKSVGEPEKRRRCFNMILSQKPLSSVAIKLTGISPLLSLKYRVNTSLFKLYYALKTKYFS